MESGWEEKKIQALFSELRTADEQVAPHFAKTWNRAQLAPRRMRAFNPAFVAATALLIFALASLAVWSKYSQQTPRNTVAVAVPPVASNAPPTKADENSGSVVMSKTNLREPVAKSRVASLAVRRHAQLLAANHKLTREAKAITSWQSPTSALLRSPSDEVFSSLPQLDQNANDLKSFLPNRPN
jgi:hypothetical protein